VTTSRYRRSLAVAIAILAIGLAVLPSQRAAALNPQEGEARSIVRDADRVYTVVAGEADGASTVTNPANLGFLRGLNALIDASWTDPKARRRGSGVGAFLGFPLPLRILALGFGYQFLWPKQPDDGSGEPEPQNQDDFYSKLSFAVALPVMRWVRGLSVGLGYSHLLSSKNFHANSVGHVDLGVGYRVNRFFALGLVGRALNRPVTGARRDVTQPLVLDPELALRPFGTPVLDLAVGSRLYPLGVPEEARFRTPLAEPRGRVLVSVAGIRLFVEVERQRYFPVKPPDEPVEVDPEEAVRIGAGIQVDFPHFGFAGGPLFGTGGEGPAIHGGSGRLRFSTERYAAVKLRPRRVTRLALAAHEGERGMWKLVQTLDSLGERRAVVLVETQGMKLGWAQVEEVREAMLRLRARGGKVAAYMEGGGLKTYFLASAADRIIAHPNVSISITGVRIETFYFADLLAKLGARAEFVRIAEYKGRPEAFERTTATEPVARQRRLLLTDVWNHALRVIATQRGHDAGTISRWIDDAPYTPERAQREAIVDALAFPDELDESVEAWLGKPVRIEKPSKWPEHADAYGPPMQIAVLYIEGDLLDTDSVTIPIIGRKIAGSNTLTKQIEKLRKNPGVRALVVRIDSPGGSVSASDAIVRELDLTRAEKPVVISMGNSAASGGYHIATGGQYIVADACTVTGSIGVFYPKVDLSGFLEKFGVGMDSVGFGKRSGLRSWFKPYTEDERAAAQRDIQASYDVFTERVQTARSMTPEEVDAVARGRVWSGVRAVEVGLVDTYGGLREAVMRARAIAGLRPGEGSVVEYPEPPGLVDRIKALFGLELPNPLALPGSPNRWTDVGAAAGVGLPSPILLVLRYLPASLWLMTEPRPLAIAEQTLVIR
jgi:protease-4